MVEVDQFIRGLALHFEFTYHVIQYPERSFFYIKIEDLYLDGRVFDISELSGDRDGIDINIELQNSKFVNSTIQLPTILNQIEFIECEFINSPINMGNQSHLDDQHATGGDLNQHSPIISLNQCQVDSLSMFDEINTQFILQCIETHLDRLHTSDTLPSSLSILSTNNCQIDKMGTIRTNRGLQLLSLEIFETEEDYFVVEIYSSKLMKIRIMGIDDRELYGSLKFFVEPSKLYFIDLSKFKLSIHYDPSSLLPDFISKLHYFKLPMDVEVDEKMISLFRLLNVSLHKNNL